MNQELQPPKPPDPQWKLVLGGGALVFAVALFLRLDGCKAQDGTAPVPSAAATPAPAPAPAPAPNRGSLSSADYGDKWPLSVSSGTAVCIKDGPLRIAMFESGGRRYAVNGTAKSPGNMQRHNLADVKEIWREDPTNPGARIPIGPVLDRALAMCEAP